MTEVTINGFKFIHNFDELTAEQQKAHIETYNECRAKMTMEHIKQLPEDIQIPVYKGLLEQLAHVD